MVKNPASTTPLSPAATDAGLAGEQAGIRVCESPGALDSQRMRRKAQLVTIACDIASVAKRYQKTHHALFGFSLRKVLRKPQSGKQTDFPSLEIELDSIESESKRIRLAIDNAGLEGLPRHVKTAIAIRDALEEYAKAVSDAASNLNL
ncbi:hypothetical protein N9H39_09050, partial [Gammaproteobacteria bacterium]|nr:hypothetical protein [Gammaproteobacteria bacterium]